MTLMTPSRDPFSSFAIVPRRRINKRLGPPLAWALAQGRCHMNVGEGRILSAGDLHLIGTLERVVALGRWVILRRRRLRERPDATG